MAGRQARRPRVRGQGAIPYPGGNLKGPQTGTFPDSPLGGGGAGGDVEEFPPAELPGVEVALAAEPVVEGAGMDQAMHFSPIEILQRLVPNSDFRLYVDQNQYRWKVEFPVQSHAVSQICGPL